MYPSHKISTRYCFLSQQQIDVLCWFVGNNRRPMFDHEFVGATTMEDFANGIAKGPCRKLYKYFPLGECGICRPLFMHAAGTASILNSHQVRYCGRSIARFGRCCSGLRLITSFLDLKDLVPVLPSNQVGTPPQQMYVSLLSNYYSWGRNPNYRVHQTALLRSK